MAGTARSGTRAGDATVDVAGERLTSPDRVLYPDQGLTKLDLARHYERVAELMLPHIGGRPLTLVRCPSGRQGQCFFQKHLDESAPAAVRRVQVEERDGPAWYGTVDSVAGLVSLVQLGTLEFHTSNARADRLDRPDRFLIDLDPDEGLGWGDVVTAAFEVRDLLAELGLVSFVKTTGGKGLHVVVPLVRRASWDEVKAFSRAVAALLAGAAPDRYTIELAKKKRHGRILLDYLRNTEGATAVEAWSTRARPGAPVAVPIEWDELRDGVRSDSFTVENLPDRLAALRADPWREIGTVRQSLTVPMKRKVGL
ncbi:MAG TPA: non-homologous end-joining DNA ligase [Longimicrobiales bacterium]|nr:non-homologous end-joining DNA ligase [Longimicrobiales bacterium]